MDGLKFFDRDVVDAPTEIGQTVIVKSFFGEKSIEMVVTAIYDGCFYAVAPQN